MDTFTFMIAIVLMLLAIQFQQNWLVLAIIAVLVLTLRSLKATVLLIIAGAALYLFSGSIKELWPVILFGLIILSIILGIGKKEQEDPYAGMGLDMGMGMPPMGPY